MAISEIDAARKFGIRIGSVDSASAEAEIAALRADVARLGLESRRLMAERDSAEAAELAQRSRADRAERMTDGLNRQLEAANGQVSQMTAQLNAERMARHMAEAVSNERAVHNEQLVAGIPTASPADHEPLLQAVKNILATNVSSTPAAGPLPTFEFHFQRGQNGLIKSPVTAVPKGV